MAGPMTATCSAAGQKPCGNKNDPVRRKAHIHTCPPVLVTLMTFNVTQHIQLAYKTLLSTQRGVTFGTPLPVRDGHHAYPHEREALLQSQTPQHRNTSTVDRRLFSPQATVISDGYEQNAGGTAWPEKVQGRFYSSRNSIASHYYTIQYLHDFFLGVGLKLVFHHLLLSSILRQVGEGLDGSVVCDRRLEDVEHAEYASREGMANWQIRLPHPLLSMSAQRD